MSELPPPRFRKTKSDKWAVMGPVETLTAALDGDGKVEVTKRSGDTSTFVIGSLGKPFDVDGVEMCYGYAPDEGDGDDSGGGGGQRSSGSRSGGQRSSGARSGGQQAPPPRGPAAARDALARATAPPEADPSEPLPEYQGGAEDEWQPDF